MKPIYINGKFTSQRTTGVQRFALEMVRALDTLLDKQASARQFVLLTPGGIDDLGLRVIKQRALPCIIPGLHAWEQLILPWAARKGALLSLTGSAPFGHFRQIASILDTAIYDHPEAYTRPFITWYRWLFAQQARRARLIVTLTEFSRVRLVKELKPNAPIVVVGAAAGQFDAIVADSGLIWRLGPGTGQPFMLAVGSDNPTKNFARLLKAFASVRDQSLRLVIVGGSNTSVFAAEEPDISERVIRLGVVSDAELKALYSTACGFIFPSIYEGFGLPPLEAMACGCPVAASTSASIPEVCGPGALYFDPFDIRSITHAIDSIASDAVLRKTLVEAGRARAAFYSWDHSARQLLTAIDAYV